MHLAPFDDETRFNGASMSQLRRKIEPSRMPLLCRGAELTLQDWAAADAAHPEAEDPSDLMDQPGEVIYQFQHWLQASKCQVDGSLQSACC